MKCLEKARRVGGTFIVALDVACAAIGFQFKADGSIAYDPKNGVSQAIVAPAKRQSKILVAEAARHLDVLSYLLGVDVVAKVGVEKITLRNGRIIEALPANPATIRGQTGDITFEEAQAIANYDELWQAAKSVADPTNGRPQGYRVRVNGTTLGDDNLLHKVAHTSFGDSFSRHRVDIYDAVKAGFPADIEKLRREAGSDEAFSEEYECIPSSSSSRYITAELYDSCSYDVDTELKPGSHLGTVSGMDVGRRSDGDPSVIVDVQTHTEDMLWQVECESRRGESWEEQSKWVANKLKTSQAIGIDATGMGDMFAEELIKDFSTQVKAYWFSVPVKEQLMTGLKAAMRTGKLKVRADDLELRRDVLSIRRNIKQSGRITYDAERTAKGHADRAWALAIAVDVASGGAAVEGAVKELHEFSSTHREMSDYF